VTYSPPPVGQQILDKAARAGRRLRWLVVLQVVWFFVFVAGGIDLLVTLAHNGSVDLTNCGASFVGGGSCTPRHSYVTPVSLLALGFLGFVANGYVIAWVARRYLGRAARFFLGRRQPWPATTTVTFGAPIPNVPRPPAPPAPPTQAAPPTPPIPPSVPPTG
jgi:hypothetical protein